MRDLLLCILTAIVFANNYGFTEIDQFTEFRLQEVEPTCDKEIVTYTYNETRIESNEENNFQPEIAIE